MSLPISLQIMKDDTDNETYLDYVHPLSVAASADPDTIYWD
jgi:hypothetical protein